MMEGTSNISQAIYFEDFKLDHPVPDGNQGRIGR